MCDRRQNSSAWAPSFVYDVHYYIVGAKAAALSVWNYPTRELEPDGHYEISKNGDDSLLAALVGGNSPDAIYLRTLTFCSMEDLLRVRSPRVDSSEP